MKTKVTIIYPVSLETKEVLEKAKNYGVITNSVTNQDTRELNSELPRKDLRELELFFTENEVPYDLMEYGTALTAPKLKKSRPEQEFEKEIKCEFYQDVEETDENGVIAVATLMKILNNSNTEELAGKILEEIKKSTFAFDEVEDIFEM